MIHTSDRRPIAARDTGWAHACAAAIVRAGWSANGISLVGMAAGLVAGLSLGAAAYLPNEERFLWAAAALLIPLRLLANMLDGMVAIASGTASPIGELFNEVPDRVSDTAVLVGLGVAAGEPSLGWASALTAMATAYVRLAVRAAGAPSDFRGPMAKQHRMALVTALCLWLALAPAAWRYPALVPWVLWAVIVLALVTCCRRLTRGAHVLATRSAAP